MADLTNNNKREIKGIKPSGLTHGFINAVSCGEIKGIKPSGLAHGFINAVSCGELESKLVPGGD